MSNNGKDPLAWLKDQRKVLSFEEVLSGVEERNDRNYDDVVIDGDKLTIPDDSRDHGLLLEVPYKVADADGEEKTVIRRLKATRWATNQLGKIMGVQWNKWFNPQHIKPAEIQEMVRRWLGKTGMAFRVRASEFKDDAPEKDKIDGFIRGFLNPNSSTIDDVMIFNALKNNFRGMMSDFHFIQDHMGGGITDDRSSHYTVAGEPFEIGPLDVEGAPDELRRIYEMAQREGQLPPADYGYQGFHMRNSEVGFAGWSVGAFMYRLLCLNGYISGTGSGQLLYRTHIGIDAPGIAKLLRDALLRLEAVWDQQREQILALHRVTLNEPKEEIRKYAKKAKLSKIFIESAIEAYDEEPIPSRMGVMHALSRAAQLYTDMNDRFKYESAAGNYLFA